MLKSILKNVLKRSAVTKVVDGNTACAYVAYALTENSYIFPITPASPMSEKIDEYLSAGEVNCFGQAVKLIEMQSEGGVAGAMHGSLLAGSLTSTYTASQGLLLMIPNLYKMSGELLPGVVHVAARAVGQQAINIFADHSDAMACRQTGMSMLCSGSVQEAHDFALVSHLAALNSWQPFMHFFDGFRTSHELNKISMLEYDEIRKMVDMDQLAKFRARGMNTYDPKMYGSVEHSDMFFQCSERVNEFVERVPAIVEEQFAQIESVTGRSYLPFEYYGDDNADRVIVAMGSAAYAVREAVNVLNDRGENVGVVKCNLYRPWVAENFTKVVPGSVKAVSVLDRTKESGSYYEPLYLDVRASLANESTGKFSSDIDVLGGRYGLGGFEFSPCMAAGVFDNMLPDAEKKDHFVVGINDDVTDHSLTFNPGSGIDKNDETVECLFYGIGGDGTVGANHHAIEIIGDNTDLKCQGYFAYDAKKSGGLTVSHLRFGDQEGTIERPYYIQSANYVACHFPYYLEKYDMLENIKPGGVFVLNCVWDEVGDLEMHIPAKVKKEIFDKDVQLYVINAQEIARSVGLGKRINMIMQTVFFNLSEVIPIDDAIGMLKESILKTFSKKGQEIVDMNNAAVDKTLDGLKKIDVPESWGKVTEDEISAEEQAKRKAEEDLPEHIRKILIPYSEGKGHLIPTSSCPPGGAFLCESTRYEKRGVAPLVPVWSPDKCVQGNQCALVCPHACIRPFLLAPEEEKEGILSSVSEDFDYKFSLGVSILDCEGCGQCVEACQLCGEEGSEVALEMVPLEEAAALGGAEQWDYLFNEVTDKAVEMQREGLIDPYDAKMVSLLYPYFEFSGACAGCGEAPYYKLASQLFGDRMLIGNATGCTSVYCNYAPSQAFCKDKNGVGPAWASSLFEDNSEFALGICTGHMQRRSSLKSRVEDLLLQDNIDSDLEGMLHEWIGSYEDQVESTRLGLALKSWFENNDTANDEVLSSLASEVDLFSKKSFWCVGGDGFAFDIGFGGLIHTLSCGEDLNVLILNSQVYSNTGGQASKATPMGASAKFTSSGKTIPQMDLGMIAVSLGNVYVASVSMGADSTQLLQAFKEANEYDGPSLIIAYSPCIAHGLNMTKVQEIEKTAVETGFWPLFRFHPETGFVYDSKDMVDVGGMDKIFDNEVRFKTVTITNPEEGKVLQEGLMESAIKQHEYFIKLEEVLKV